MAQGDFTKEEGQATLKAVNEMWKALPKGKRMRYAGYLNDVLLFIDAAMGFAPDKPEQRRVQ